MMLVLVVLLCTSTALSILTTKIALHSKQLPACNGCFAALNGIFYACCDDMSINNGYCTCDGDVPCTQCSPSSTDKHTVLPSPLAKPLETTVQFPFSIVQLTLKDQSLYSNGFNGWSGTCIASAPNWYCTYGTGFTLGLQPGTGGCALLVRGQTPLNPAYSPDAIIISCLSWVSNTTAVTYAAVATPSWCCSTETGLQWSYQVLVLK